MFHMISFQANGERIEHAGQKPAFFALTCNGIIIEYYTTLEAFHLGLDSCKRAVEAWQAEAKATENTSILLAA